MFCLLYKYEHTKNDPYNSLLCKIIEFITMEPQSYEHLAVFFVIPTPSCKPYEAIRCRLRIESSSQNTAEHFLVSQIPDIVTNPAAVMTTDQQQHVSTGNRYISTISVRGGGEWASIY